MKVHSTKKDKHVYRNFEAYDYQVLNKQSNIYKISLLNLVCLIIEDYKVKLRR